MKAKRTAATAIPVVTVTRCAEAEPHRHAQQPTAIGSRQLDSRRLAFCFSGRSGHVARVRRPSTNSGQASGLTSSQKQSVRIRR
jgi:hypothetical protein